VPTLEKLITTIPKALFSKDSWQTLAEYMGIGKTVKSTPLTDADTLGDFLKTRASHVTQTSLYGYLRTRAGTRYPELFEDKQILMSINMAKWQIWLACLSDLSIYVGGLIHQRSNLNSDEISLLLTPIIESILEETGVPEEASPEYPNAAEGLIRRVANCDYSTIPDDESAFSRSPEALFYWAPIADELKNRDEEIVKNSVRFRWQEIRRSARTQLQADVLTGNT
jgi:hypothetical protein